MIKILDFFLFSLSLDIETNRTLVVDCSLVLVDRWPHPPSALVSHAAVGVAEL